MIYNSKVGYSARQIEKSVGAMYFVVLLLALKETGIDVLD